MPPPRLYSIPPNQPFLPVLVQRICDGTLLGDWPRQGAFWLADVTIILPTRRARFALAAEFARQMGGAALLPDIRTFGGEAAEEEPFLPPFDAEPIAPAASLLERRLALSHLVRSFAEHAGSFASPPSAAEIFWLADSLGELVDDLTIENVRREALRTLAPDALADNWRQILGFLDIALEAWPKMLTEAGRIDAAAARNARLIRQATSAAMIYRDRPVIAAGSTGSIPATAALLRAIAALPSGALVLPGLDTGLNAAQHEALLRGDTTQGHPQYGLMKLLRGLDATPAMVEDLVPADDRAALVRAALAPAVETVLWPGQRGTLRVTEALAGVSVLAAPNADLEARAIALAARDALAGRRTVGIVARDQTLARRIAAELKRHGIGVDDAAGTPLHQTAAGRLARQAIAVVASDYAPVDTVALLRNAAVKLGLERDAVRRAANILDRELRARRPRSGLAGLVALVADEQVRDVLDRLGAALAPLAALAAEGRIAARDLAAGVVACLRRLAPEGELPGQAELHRWADETERAWQRGASFPPADLEQVLASLVIGITVPNPAPARDDIHIWGELEARLQNPDLMILAGVNEGIWPAVADPGPWMSRGMRIAIGLEPAERRQGQAAHDFAMALGNRAVLVAYAERIGTAPALPSPLLQRLFAFIGEDEEKRLRALGGRWLAAARALDHAGLPRPAQRPVPSPPAAMRPRQLSITDIEPLMRSPYDIYAKRVLRLKRLEPLGTEPSARERGTMIHEVFEAFVKAKRAFDAPDALATMMAMAEVAFAGLDAVRERREIWLKRFERAARQFLAFEQRRQGDIEQRFAELKGEMPFPLPGGFVLTGKADRIDLRRDGTLEILDFKTGSVPQPKDMQAFDAPQLLLEAVMARVGGFKEVPPAGASALTYVKIGLGPAAFQLRPFKTLKGQTLDSAGDEASRRTQALIGALLVRDDLPLAARIRPKADTGRKPYPGDYDHLARTDEWTRTAGVDDP